MSWKAEAQVHMRSVQINTPSTNKMDCFLISTAGPGVTAPSLQAVLKCRCQIGEHSALHTHRLPNRNWKTNQGLTVSHPNENATLASAVNNMKCEVEDQSENHTQALLQSNGAHLRIQRYANVLKSWGRSSQPFRTTNKHSLCKLAGLFTYFHPRPGIIVSDFQAVSKSRFEIGERSVLQTPTPKQESNEGKA